MAESEKTSAAGWWPVKGNGNLTTENRPLGAFTQVENATSLAVTLSEGAPSVSVTVDSNLQSLLLTTVNNGRLLITTNQSIQASKGAQVVLSLTGLAGITLTGSGDMSATATAAANLALNISGGGALTYTGTAQAVSAQQSGPGQVTLSGSAQSLVANLSGPGNFNAQAFPVSGAAQLINSSPGLLTATANGTVSFDLSGPGNIDWYGTATVTGSKNSGSGSINHK